MNATRFRGVTTALVTPFTADGQIDEARLRELVDWQIAEGIDGLLAAGTTGESATLSHEEHHRVMEIVVDQAAGRVPVMCGAGSNSTAEAISLTQHAEKIGADAVLSVAPYYNRPTQRGLYEHYRKIAESTTLPVFVYNVPSRTGTNVAPETLRRLAELPNVVGVKEASGNLSQIMQILAQRPTDFLVLSGDDALTFPLVALGGDGVVSVASNEVPGLMTRMVRAMLQGDWDTARRLHFRLLPLMKANFVETNPIPVKTALALMGKLEPNFRLPLVPASEETRSLLEKLLAELEVLSSEVAA
ncbi:MAG TPA: 4-hydroxy-tetrahydrodipicolinate synthase [Bacteroidetes bacterium]|nr:4-hydroxy-tetrahydrodipicolinate synthase [Bacteroidota bacterium]